MTQVSTESTEDDKFASEDTLWADRFVDDITGLRSEKYALMQAQVIELRKINASICAKLKRYNASNTQSGSEKELKESCCATCLGSERRLLSLCEVEAARGMRNMKVANPALRPILVQNTVQQANAHATDTQAANPQKVAQSTSHITGVRLNESSLRSNLGPSEVVPRSFSSSRPMQGLSKSSTSASLGPLENDIQSQDPVHPIHKHLRGTSRAPNDADGIQVLIDTMRIEEVVEIFYLGLQARHRAEFDRSTAPSPRRDPARPVQSNHLPSIASMSLASGSRQIDAQAINRDVERPTCAPTSSAASTHPSILEPGIISHTHSENLQQLESNEVPPSNCLGPGPAHSPVRRPTLGTALAPEVTNDRPAAGRASTHATSNGPAISPALNFFGFEHAARNLTTALHEGVRYDFSRPWNAQDNPFPARGSNHYLAFRQYRHDLRIWQQLIQRQRFLCEPSKQDFENMQYQGPSSKARHVADTIRQQPIPVLNQPPQQDSGVMQRPNHCSTVDRGAPPTVQQPAEALIAQMYSTNSPRLAHFGSRVTMPLDVLGHAFTTIHGVDPTQQHPAPVYPQQQMVPPPFNPNENVPRHAPNPGNRSVQMNASSDRVSHAGAPVRRSSRYSPRPTSDDDDDDDDDDDQTISADGASVSTHQVGALAYPADLAVNSSTWGAIKTRKRRQSELQALDMTIPFST